MSVFAVGIIGASGYSGIELTRILAGHPGAELRFLASERWRGDHAVKRLGLAGGAGKLTYSSPDRALDLARGCQVVFLATPAEVSLELVPRLLELGARVIDLSGAFRLRDPELYPRWYGFAHPRPQLLAEAVYGLPELFAGEIRGARLVANPGCYATAAALALAPLLAEGVITDDPLIVDAASGTTGAGRKANEDMSFSEVAEDFRAYRVLRHQHTPEIAQTLSRSAGRPAKLTFTAHLLPIKRGILATAYARLAPGRGPGDPLRALMHIYAQKPFLSVAGTPDEVAIKHVAHSNRCQLSAAADDSSVVVTAAIDNLVKGAAGQAVQSFNLLMGLDETAGLANLVGGHP